MIEVGLLVVVDVPLEVLFQVGLRVNGHVLNGLDGGRRIRNHVVPACLLCEGSDGGLAELLHLILLVEAWRIILDTSFLCRCNFTITTALLF